jgi:hypothetical protein
MGTKTNPGRYECLAKAEPDEPVFVLRAKDPNAVPLVWLWATMAEMQSAHEPEKVAEARQLMMHMVDWAASRGIRPHGLGVVTLSAVMEMVRAANTAVAKLRSDPPKNIETTTDTFRLFFAEMTADPLPAEQEVKGGDHVSGM